jgi:Tfp pilus assembly protein PilX
MYGEHGEIMKNIHTNRKWQSQQGVVLFIALIALVVMSLAAVALVRSVDTFNLVAGNLAFKQAATSSADAGIEAAVWTALAPSPSGWLATTQAGEASKDPWMDPTHAFNVDAPANGYYSSIAVPADLTAASTWTSAASRPGIGANFDTNGLDSTTDNTVRYVIQRVCRTPNQVLSTANCLFSDASEDNATKRGKDYSDAGLGSGAISGSPIYRITARVTGPRNTVSYIQAYAY